MHAIFLTGIKLRRRFSAYQNKLPDRQHAAFPFASPEGSIMSKGSEDPRIAAMFGGDRIWSIVAIVALWLTVVFVFVETLPYTGSAAVVAALVIGGGLVLLFNTAAIAAMLKHYDEDKEHIYGLDIHYLDEMNKAKR
jgi:hypothetical protein